jgi:phage terminase large subunit
LSSTLKLPEAFQFLRQDRADDGGPVRFRAAYGGRGSAKSRSFVREIVLQGAERPERVLCCREIQRSIRDSVKRLLDDEIARAGLGSFYESTESEIRGKNGTLFIFAGLRSNPDSVKSAEGLTKAVVFEANKVSQRSWELLTPTVREPNSEIWAEWNPEFPTDPVDVMFRGDAGSPPGSIVRRVNWEDNPWFPEVLRRDMEWDRSRDPDKYAHIWLGEYQRNSESRVFRNWKVEEFDRPSGTVFRLGADWGYAVDPSVLVRCSIDGNRLYVDYEAYMIGCEITQLPDLFRRVPDSEKWFITADSARPETISHMRRHGYPKINPAIKGARSLEEGVAFLQSYDIVVHPRCQHVIDELTLYSYKTDPLTGKVIPLLEDKNNHCIDALRYALEGARKAGKSDAFSKPIRYNTAGIV